MRRWIVQAESWAATPDDSRTPQAHMGSIMNNKEINLGAVQT